MNNNFFTMLFFTIGIIVTIKFILKTIIELRNHWASGGWKNKRECFFDYCSAKINKPVVVCKSVSSEKFYPQMADDYDDDDDEYGEEIYNYETDEKGISYTQDEDELEVDIYEFKNIKEARKCCKSLNQDDRYIYDINGRVYGIFDATITEQKMKSLGAIVMPDEEKYDVMSEIVAFDTRVFEFKDEESANYFLNKYKVEIINYLDHIFVDLSDRTEEEMPLIRRMAEECFGLEVSDKFLVEKLKSLKQN